MNKQIFVLNGTAGAGKDTFADFLKKYIHTKHISSITPIKEAAKALGWNGNKTDEARKFLCELKKFVNSQGNYIWDYLDREVDEFRKDDKTNVLLIDIREPEEIEKAVKRYNAKTILITRHGKTVDFLFPAQFTIPSNSADQYVYRYEYDFEIKNSGSLADFEKTVVYFAEKHILPSSLTSANP